MESLSDDTPLIRGSLPEHLRVDIPIPEGENEQVSYVRQLLALHPDLKLGFPVEELVELDPGVRYLLISDIQEMLGIKIKTWEQLNDRRLDLLDRKYAGILDVQEASELEHLEAATDEWLEKGGGLTLKE